MEVEITRTQWFTTDDVTPGSVTFGPATVRPVQKDPGDSVDGVVVGCEATSTFASKLGNAYVEILYLDATGKIIGGDANNSTIDNQFIAIPGTARTTFEMKELFSPPGGVPAAQCYGSYVTPT
jgi:hypothetical protein